MKNSCEYVIYESRCGEVTDVYITEKGYAFVTMADDEGASQAVKELNGQVVDGQEIKVDNAHSNSGGGRGGDRRGGRGGGKFTFTYEILTFENLWFFVAIIANKK